jgi:hypothetical protein
MSRHRLQEASTAEATVELAAAPRPRRASSTAVPRRAAEPDRAALAKEILAAVDDRIPLSEDVRAGKTIGGNRPAAGVDAPSEANAQAARGSRHRRTSAASRPRWGRRRGRTMLLITGLAVGLVAVPAVGIASAGPCRVQQAARQLIFDLGGTQASSDPCSQTAEVGPVNAVATTATDDLSFDRRARALARPTARATPSPAPAAAPEPTTAPRAEPTTSSGAGDGTTAAATFGWGTPVKADDFGGDLSQWGLYDGPGHAGKGRRAPSASKVANGLLTITGDPSGTTDGMAWGSGQKYGRWEGRVRAPASDPTYNALLLLWPDAENYPVGGEIDFMEMTDNTRQSTDLFLHYGADDSQVHGDVKIDATQWHNWAVEWTPQGVTTYVDGKPWYHTADTSILPPGPMHLCIQLDWFPGEGNGGGVRPSKMQVDWVRQYAV